MKVFYGPDFKIKEDTAVAIGKFDGLHKGHLYVLDILLQEAKNNSLKSTVYTFLQNPRAVLKHEKFIPLMTNEEKTMALEKLKIDYLIYENFDEDFCTLKPEEFVREILVKKISAKVVVMGENSTFGKNGSGDIHLMRELGEKFNFTVRCADLILNNGKIISSSGIREDIFGKNVK